jgi:hypothetical protein
MPRINNETMRTPHDSAGVESVRETTGTLPGMAADRLATAVKTYTPAATAKPSHATVRSAPVARRERRRTASTVTAAAGQRPTWGKVTRDIGKKAMGARSRTHKAGRDNWGAPGSGEVSAPVTAGGVGAGWLGMLSMRESLEEPVEAVKDDRMDSRDKWERTPAHEVAR